MNLSNPITVRLPEDVWQEIQEESEATSIPCSTIIRSDVMRVRRGSRRVSGDYTNHAVTTRKMEEGQGDGV